MQEKIIQSWKLDNGLEICHVEKFRDDINDLVREYFDHNYPILRWTKYISEQEKQNIKELDSKLNHKERIDIGIFEGGKIVGWSYGWQGGLESANYYMANSCIISKFRRQGLYTELLSKVIEVSKKKGFQTITSRHVASNNAVLIPKLKAGFKVTGMELSEIHGNLIHLTYFNNQLRSDCYDTKSGLSKAKDPIIKELFS